MTQVSLVVQPSSVFVRKSGPATGNIWIEVSDVSFPAARWNDFVVVVLTWWVDALVCLLGGATTRETVRFMEGPYEVEILMTPQGVLQFIAKSGAGRLDVRELGEAAPAHFARSLLDRATEILSICRNANGWSQDAEELEESCALLSKVVDGFHRGRQ